MTTNNTNIVIAIISGIVAIIVAYIKVMYTKKKNIKKSTEDIKLKNHIFFTKTLWNMNQLYETFTLKDEGKEEVFRHILYYSFKIMDMEFKELANKIDNGEISDINYLKIANIETLESSYRAIRNLHLKEGSLTPDEREVLRIVLCKFSKWNSGRHATLKNSILNITTSEYYNDVVTAQAAVLDMLCSHLSDMLNDGILTFDTINGDLNGFIFKGHKIGHSR